MIIELVLELLMFFFALIGYLAYYTLKGLMFLLKYVYHKLEQGRPKVPSLLRYDKDTNELEVLK
jgi:hypothetical protein